ncbi:hypothetical protein MKEN_00024600 [Mycena kentingensis (nom. inval.)]|nr:hypothetical protein MKEN_00024600 [Mycena kentingensis (nom. inval.)]
MAPASKRQKLGKQLAKSRQQEADDGTDASSCDENTPQPLSASSNRRNAPRDTTRAELARKDAEIHTLKTRVLELEREVQRVEDVEHELEALQGSYNALEEKRRQLYVEKRNLDKAKRRVEEDLREETRSHTKRVRRLENQLETQADASATTTHSLDAVIDDLRHQLVAQSATVRQLESELTSARAKIASHTIHIQSLQFSLKAKQDTITAVRQQLYAAEKREKTAKSSLAKLQKEYNRVRVWRPKEKGVFRPEWRALARDLVGAGVPLAKLRLVAESFARTVGVEIKGKFMSARTGARVIDEGGLLGELQNARELLDCDGFTEATDGTGYRGITYEGHHNTLRAPTYAPGVDDTDKSTWKVQTRFVNVTNSVSHTAEAQFRGIRKTAERLADLYNRSPFSAQDARIMDKDDYFRKKMGENRDHAADGKKAFKISAEYKKRIVFEDLGRKAIENEIFDDAEILLATLGVDDAQLCEYHQVGKEELQKMPADEIASLRRRIVERQFGERRFEFLTEDQKKNALTMVFGGCCAHKELNVVRIAYTHVNKFYADYGLARPVLLANKANDSILQLGTNENGLTGVDSAAIKKALDASTCGAIKLLQLMSSLLKNIERGYQLRTTMYMQREKKELYDLDESGEITSVSTNRIYTLIEEIVDAKTKSGQLNHVEKNVLKGLDCPATMTDSATTNPITMLRFDAERARLIELEKRIAELERLLAPLRSEHETIQAQLGAYTYPVLSLPHEITSEIFLQTLPDPPATPPLIGLNSPQNLLGICSQWRDIALATHGLWQTIHVPRVPSSSTQTPPAIRAWLSRSGNLPLSVAWDYLLGTAELLPALSEHRLRWRKLDLSLNADEIHQLSGPAPQLVQLYLSAWGSFSREPLPQFGPTPLLRSVGLSDVSYNAAALSWERLTELNIIGGDLTETLAVLKLATNLMHCRLELVTEGPVDLVQTSEGERTAVVLPHLETLILEGVAALAILTAFNLPVLRRLQVVRGQLLAKLAVLLGIKDLAGAGRGLKNEYAAVLGLSGTLDACFLSWCSHQ